MTRESSWHTASMTSVKWGWHSVFSKFVFESGQDGPHSASHYNIFHLQEGILTFTARGSYRLGPHLNTSKLLEARRSHTLGQPQPQPFKYFALNIFREISLILSPRSFSSFMLRLIYQLRENNMYPFFIWGCLYTATKVGVRPCIAYFFCFIRLVGEWLTLSSAVRDHTTLFGL